MITVGPRGVTHLTAQAATPLTRATPRIAITPDALEAHVRVDGDLLTGRQLFAQRSKALGRYKHPDLRTVSNILGQPSSTLERFNNENGAKGLVFHKSADFKDGRRFIDALSAMNVDHLITGDSEIAALAGKAAIATTLTTGKKIASLVNKAVARRSGKTGLIRPVKLAFTPGTLQLEGPAAEGARNTTQLLIAHAGEHVVDTDAQGTRIRPYHVKLISNEISDGARSAAGNGNLVIDAHEHYASQAAILKSLLASPPDLFLTEEHALAKAAMDHGILAGVPTRTALRNTVDRNPKLPLTWVFDFDGVTTDRATESALLGKIDRDPENGRADAWAHEGLNDQTHRQPGPAFGLLKVVSHNAENALHNADPAEILTSRPYFSAGTVRTTLAHYNVPVSGVTVIDEGSKGAQLERLNGILLDDSAYKVKDVEAKGQPAILVPTLADENYTLFKKFGTTSA